jgi:hypothetical protein
MWVLDIRADYREKGQEIKNEPSIRIFPLHPQIIEEGVYRLLAITTARPVVPGLLVRSG